MIRFRRMWLPTLLIAHATSVGAAALQVAPTRLALPPDNRAVALTVTNTGNAPTLLQLEPMRWSQDTGSDDYSATDELIVSPPIFTLDPGAEQIVRLARRDGAAPSEERAYRLFIQEVPTPASRSSQELTVVLRIGVPMFLTPATAPEAALQWNLECTHTGSPVLRILNPGARTVRIDELVVRADTVSHPERALYVLAGAIRLLSLHDVPASARHVELRALMGKHEVQESARCER